MAKIYGLFGSMTGKLADTVMSVRNGEQLARKYQPIVYNPSTPAQIAQRAKMKLMSQLSAVMAPVIAIPRKGSISSRNLFTKKNFALTEYTDSTASVTLANIQLTDSVLSLPNVSATRGTTDIEVALALQVAGLSRVVYVAFVKQNDNTLRYHASTVVEKVNDRDEFVGTIPTTSLNAVIYAYGVRDNTEAARVKFGNLEAPTAQSVADLIVTRTLLESDISLTETKGVELPIA